MHEKVVRVANTDGMVRKCWILEAPKRMPKKENGKVHLSAKTALCYKIDQSYQVIQRSGLARMREVREGNSTSLGRNKTKPTYLLVEGGRRQLACST